MGNNSRLWFQKPCLWNTVATLFSAPHLPTSVLPQLSSWNPEALLPPPLGPDISQGLAPWPLPPWLPHSSRKGFKPQYLYSTCSAPTGVRLFNHSREYWTPQAEAAQFNWFPRLHKRICMTEKAYQSFLHLIKFDFAWRPPLKPSEMWRSRIKASECFSISRATFLRPPLWRAH